MDLHDDGWGRWFRDNSDKFLLCAMITGMMGYQLHIMHDSKDHAQVQFVNGLINTLSGALITLITGNILRKTSTATVSSKDPETGATANVATVKAEDK